MEVTSSKRDTGYGKRLGAVLPVTVVMPFIYFQFFNLPILGSSIIAPYSDI